MDFSLKIISKSREIYKNGSAAEDKDIEDMANYQTSLQAQLNAPSTNSSPVHADQLFDDGGTLLKVATECSKTAKDLIAKLQSLQVQPSSHQRVAAVSKSFKAHFKKSSINSIEERLERYQKLLDTQILITLRFVYAK